MLFFTAGAGRTSLCTCALAISKVITMQGFLRGFYCLRRLSSGFLKRAIPFVTGSLTIWATFEGNVNYRCGTYQHAHVMLDSIPAGWSSGGDRKPQQRLEAGVASAGPLEALGIEAVLDSFAKRQCLANTSKPTTSWQGLTPWVCCWWELRWLGDLVLGVLVLSSDPPGVMTRLPLAYDPSLSSPGNAQNIL